MTVYAPTDVRSINVPSGCGSPHEAGDLAEGELFTVDCPACEPGIIAARTGWAHTLEGVHLTPDEIAVVDAQKAQAERAKAQTWGDPHALGKSLAEALAAQVPAPASVDPMIVEQMASMAAKIEELSEKLAAATAKAAGPDEPAADVAGEHAVSAPRRGRPPKNPAASE